VPRSPGTPWPIQFTHRLGAVVAGSALLLLGLLAAKAGRRRLFWTGSMLVAAVLLQIALGLATVHFGAPSRWRPCTTPARPCWSPSWCG